MCLVFIGVGIVVVCGGIIWSYLDEYNDERGGFACICGILLVAIFTVMFVVNISKINDLSNYSNYIEILENENREVESRIDVAVAAYLEHESNIYSSYLNSSSDTKIYIVSAIPELSSQALIQSQIEIYSNNIRTISKYKLEQAKLPHYKWFAYFGK